MRDAFRKRTARVAFIVFFAALFCIPSPGWAGTISYLGSAQSFAVLGYAGVTNGHSDPNPQTQIYGNVGATGGSGSMTGFPPGIITGGTKLGSGTAADQALADITAAVTALGSLGVTSSINTNLGGQTLVPGVYSLSGAADLLTGTLILNAQNNPNALFVFKLPDAFATASISKVTVIGADPSTQVYWLLGSSAELGSNSVFEGNILAYAGIALDPTAKIECGRAFSTTESVTLIDNVISGNCALDTFGSTTRDFGSLGFSGGPQRVIPEPGTLTLLGMGLGAAFLLRRKFRPTR